MYVFKCMSVYAWDSIRGKCWTFILSGSNKTKKEISTFCFTEKIQQIGNYEGKVILGRYIVVVCEWNTHHGTYCVAM